MAGSANVIKNMWAWATLKRAGIEATSLDTAGNMGDWAKLNARWKDDSGNARAGLHAGMYWESPTVLKIFIAHGMDYGVYLELAHDRKYQILEPTINKFKDSWFAGIKRIMEK